MHAVSDENQKHFPLFLILTGRLEDLSQSVNLDDTVEDMWRLVNILVEFYEEYTELVSRLGASMTHVDIHIDCPVIRTGQVGRPTIQITREQIEAMMELGYTYVQMATILGVSERTLIRKREQLGLPVGLHHSNMSDDDLDTLVKEITQVSFVTGSSLAVTYICKQTVALT